MTNEPQSKFCKYFYHDLYDVIFIRQETTILPFYFFITITITIIIIIIIIIITITITIFSSFCFLSICLDVPHLTNEQYNLWKLTLRGHLNTDVQAGLELGTITIIIIIFLFFIISYYYYLV